MANNQQLATDNFASGALAAGWSVIPTNSFSAVVNAPPNVAQPPSVGAAGGRQYWSGLTWPNDQISEITVNAFTGELGTQLELWVRVQSGAYSGYLVTISGSPTVATLYRMDAGTPTQLAVSSSITVAAGDIFTFAASGSALVLYQNYTQIVRWMDATYTSGSPGMGSASTVAVAHARISAWRGYNTVQQDGIWQKQGITILPPLAGDFTSGSGGVANATMLYEGNAQILSGTVYKMWFSAGGPGAETNTYYAESLDGIAWTRFGSAVITGQGSPFIIKNGATYYLYTQPNGSNGVGNFSVYTSSNGTSWTSQATNILGALGGSGVWDGVVQWYFQPVAIIGATWYGVYSGANSNATTLLKLGIATSPDGIVWTKYGSNPVLTAANGGSVVNSCALAKVGSTYYMWVFAMQPGRGGTPTLLNPGEGVLYSTPDFINWTLVHHSVHASQLSEGVNYVQGQCYPNAIFTVGKKTYMYIQAAVADSGAPSIYQMTLAIAPATIPQIVTMNEDAVQNTASDFFARGAGGLGANWTTPTGGTALQIASSGVVESTAVNPAIGYAAYTKGTFSNDQYAEITVLALANNQCHLNAMVRMSLAQLTGYLFDIQGPLGSSGNIKIYSEVNNTYTQIGPTLAVTPQVGDVFRMQVVGNVLTVFQNGFLVMQVEDVNNTITSGYPGVRVAPDAVAITNAQISGFSGGNANVSPYGTGSGEDLGPGYDFTYRL